jgi:ribose transport system ATP-binding protein
MLFGLDPSDEGEVRVAGEPLSRPSPAKCIAHKMAFLTEDRRTEGLLLEAPLDDNVSLARLRDTPGSVGWTGVLSAVRRSDWPAP